MKLLLCVLMLASGSLAQSDQQAHSSGRSERDAFYARQSTIRQRGTEALEREKTHSKAHLCAKAEQGGQAAIGACLVTEGKTTEQNYLIYIRSIGALLRLSETEGAGSKSSVTPQRLPFDAAEDAWRIYRHQSCTSMATQWEGGDQAPVAYANCQLTLTWNHMNELADLYADLWH